MRIDYLFGKAIFKQLTEIKDKAFLQYVRPYSRVSLIQVAKELQVNEKELLDKFIGFIRSGKLEAKIDLDNNSLEKKGSDALTNVKKTIRLLK